MSRYGWLLQLPDLRRNQYKPSCACYTPGCRLSNSDTTDWTDICLTDRQQKFFHKYILLYEQIFVFVKSYFYLYHCTSKSSLLWAPGECKQKQKFIFTFAKKGRYAIIPIWETIEPKAALPLLFFGGFKVALQISCPLGTKERRTMQCMLHMRIWLIPDKDKFFDQYICSFDWVSAFHML